MVLLYELVCKQITFLVAMNKVLELKQIELGHREPIIIKIIETFEYERNYRFPKVTYKLTYFDFTLNFFRTQVKSRIMIKS